MIWRIGALLAGATLCLVGAPSLASAEDWGPYSLRLSEGMTEQQAINTVGYLPNRAEQDTCGGNTTSGEWSCRILTFGDRRNNLTIWERREGEVWLVNNWNVHSRF
jgi:hypothetical protein